MLDPARLDANIAASKNADAISGAKANGNSFSPRPQPSAPCGLDENLDLQVMRVLQGKTTVIPVIAKADSVTSAHMIHLKGAVWESIKRAKLEHFEAIGLGEGAEDTASDEDQPGSLNPHPLDERKLSDTSHLESASESDSSLSPSDLDTAKPAKAAARHSRTPSSPMLFPMRSPSATGIPYLPLSVISPDLYEPDVAGRKFPWGFADPYDPEHCDFVRLKDMVFAEWRGDLREASREIWYEGWRTSRLNRRSEMGEPKNSPRPNPTGFTSSVKPLPRMNDPGLDEPIQKESEGIEQDRKDDEDIEKEDEQTFLNPRYLTLHEPRRYAAAKTQTVDGGLLQQPSLYWPLIGINAVSLAFALGANMALLLNMARRVSFAIAQPITIIGWYIASILLIALVVAATYGLKIPGQNRALTQAFYYAIIAAGLYFIISTLMVITVYGAYTGHYPKEFTLTMSQRTLMLQTISFMFYMLAGAAVYSRVEGWKFLDAIYFTNYTLLTVGIGDYAPLTHTGRALLFPYAVGGIVTLGLVVGSIRTLVLERGKQKITRRLVEKRREQVVRRMTKKGEDHKLKPIESHQEAKAVGMTEQERRKIEFDLMREIQNHASQREKWNALLLSGSAWLVLWLVGAAVFWKAEHAQEWSYFGALYFAYTSLLTIGYGDLKPFSNAGKPAFVFWSLLAVPALTIVISNMGDTVVKGVRDLTDYLGEFTLLPGESPTKQRMKQIASKARYFGKGNGGRTLSYRPSDPV
ncbi:MAG: hypothetical protein Q9214_005707, partial [Letrouitia sp. 1 TL-2023]